MPVNMMNKSSSNTSVKSISSNGKVRMKASNIDSLLFGNNRSVQNDKSHVSDGEKALIVCAGGEIRSMPAARRNENNHTRKCYPTQQNVMKKTELDKMKKNIINTEKYEDVNNNTNKKAAEEKKQIIINAKRKHNKIDGNDENIMFFQSVKNPLSQNRYEDNRLPESYKECVDKMNGLISKSKIYIDIHEQFEYNEAKKLKEKDDADKFNKMVEQMRQEELDREMQEKDIFDKKKQHATEILLKQMEDIRMHKQLELVEKEHDSKLMKQREKLTQVEHEAAKMRNEEKNKNIQNEINKHNESILEKKEILKREEKESDAKIAEFVKKKDNETKHAEQVKIQQQLKKELELNALRESQKKTQDINEEIENMRILRNNYRQEKLTREAEEKAKLQHQQDRDELLDAFEKQIENKNRLEEARKKEKKEFHETIIQRVNNEEIEQDKKDKIKQQHALEYRKFIQEQIKADEKIKQLEKESKLADAENIKINQINDRDKFEKIKQAKYDELLSIGAPQHLLTRLKNIDIDKV